ncbi:hypothetical protein COO72_05390 [Bifidobacterium callitrichos]|nr:hypothetical protein COO72_05390 [Bifidobacterium callitrichos]
MDTTTTSLQLIQRTSQWLVDLTNAFAAWPTPFLIAALLLLITVSGVTGRAVIGASLPKQLLWGTVTVAVSLMALAVIWALVVRFVPVDMLETILNTLHLLKPMPNATGAITTM